MTTAGSSSTHEFDTHNYDVNTTGRTGQRVTIRLAVGWWYDSLETGCHLANVGLDRPYTGIENLRPEGMQFFWRWNRGTISLNLEVIWELSVQQVEGVIR